MGRKFGLLGRVYLNALAARLKKIGIKKHFSILILIDKIGDRCSQKFIADTLHIDKTMLVGSLDELEAKGFIKRVQNPADRREYWIQLTAKGKRHVPTIKAAMNDLNNTIMKGFNDAGVTNFHRQLQVIYENLRGINKKK